MKNKIATIGIIIATIILAGVALFTAVRLYQLRQEAVAPTAPTSKPKAGEPQTGEPPTACTSLVITLSTATPTITPTGGPTTTPTATAVPTPPTCAADEHLDLSGTKCLKWELGGPPTPPPAASPTATAKAGGGVAKPTGTQVQAELPDAGTSLPTIFGVGIGTLLLIGALILAL
jgi:hypothetical protein